MPIETGGSGRYWLLSGARSSYAIGLTSDDGLVNLHWGPRISLADAAELAGAPEPHAHAFEGAADGFEEYPVEGGLRFARPALSVRGRTADAVVRGTEWTFAGCDEELSGSVSGSDAELHLRFVDALLSLEITLHYRLRAEFDLLERWATIACAADAAEPVELLRADAAAWTLPLRDQWRLSELHGRFVGESQLERGTLMHGEHVYGSRHGHTSHNHLPWFALDDGSATEERGQVWTGALAWSGNWRFTVQLLPMGRVQVTGGAGGDESGLIELAPGASYESPVFAALYTGDGFGGASRAWHAYQLACVIPKAEQLRPVLYNSWEATHFDVSESSQRKLADRAADLGVELFVLDDGWFGARRDDRAGLGDWTPSPEQFPGGLRPLAEHVNGLGMQFGIWVEPEMVNPDSDLYRAHPEWAQHYPGRRRTQWRNQLVLNLGLPEVREYLFGQLDTLLGSAPIDYVKWDFNRSFAEPGWPGEPYPERLGLEHVYGFYGLLDRLRAAHPTVAFESCSAGGGRIDLGVLARTDMVWVSDNTDPLDRLRIQHGLSQLHPARVASAWVTDSPNVVTGRVTPLKFRFVSSMAGLLGLGGNLVEWSDAELDEARGWVARYKKLRHVVQHGELYRLRPPGEGLTAVQFVRGDETVVLAWLGAQAFAAAPGPLRLAALDPAARYRDLETGFEYSGALLRQHGLATGLSGDYAAGIFHLRRVSE
ncbi:alpha-galactosidase [Actinospica sp.]|uniref:alpha-galactosidase n=1 Tax=Actinospica sp. TaxID=1872142 RepID=UPI002C291987|nr:alpha-galactosidase [Actinospica sp.]HWG23490.1 alpha-galactosidase [Actinospica sp.]